MRYLNQKYWYLIVFDLIIYQSLIKIELTDSSKDVQFKLVIFSAYCGGLWLGALYCMIEMAKCLEKSDDFIYYSKMLENAKNSYENLLWNGSFYNFDGSAHESKSIMADQLCAHWYLRCCGVKDYPVRIFYRFQMTVYCLVCHMTPI